MIRVLGMKRILTLVILVLLNGAAAAGVYLYLMPESIQKEQEYHGLQSKIGSVSSDIGRMQVEFDQLAQQQEEFNQLKERGFFGDQGRREVEKVFEQIQTQAGVISAVANIQAGAVEDNEEAQKADHKILVSPVNIKIAAVDDVDVFRYLYLLEQYFPGHVAIQKLNLERKSDVSGTVLRGIASGDNPALVNADIDILWRTMIPQKDIIGAPAQGAQK